MGAEQANNKERILELIGLLMSEIRPDSVTPFRMGTLLRDIFLFKGDSSGGSGECIPNVYNVSEALSDYDLEPAKARAGVPLVYRGAGLILVYRSKGMFTAELFDSVDLSGWTDESLWVSLLDLPVDTESLSKAIDQLAERVRILESYHTDPPEPPGPGVHFETKIIPNGAYWEGSPSNMNGIFWSMLFKEPGSDRLHCIVAATATSGSCPDYTARSDDRGKSWKRHASGDNGFASLGEKVYGDGAYGILSDGRHVSMRFISESSTQLYVSTDGGQSFGYKGSINVKDPDTGENLIFTSELFERDGEIFCFGYNRLLSGISDKKNWTKVYRIVCRDGSLRNWSTEKIVDFSDCTLPSGSMAATFPFITEVHAAMIDRDVVLAIRSVGDTPCDYNRSFYLVRHRLGGSNPPISWKSMQLRGFDGEVRLKDLDNRLSLGGHLKGCLPRITSFSYGGKKYLVLLWHTRRDYASTAADSSSWMVVAEYSQYEQFGVRIFDTLLPFKMGQWMHANGHSPEGGNGSVVSLSDGILCAVPYNRSPANHNGCSFLWYDLRKLMEIHAFNKGESAKAFREEGSVRKRRNAPMQSDPEAARIEELILLLKNEIRTDSVTPVRMADLLDKIYSLIRSRFEECMKFVTARLDAHIRTPGGTETRFLSVTSENQRTGALSIDADGRARIQKFHGGTVESDRIIATLEDIPSIGDIGGSFANIEESITGCRFLSGESPTMDVYGKTFMLDVKLTDDAFQDCYFNDRKSPQDFSVLVQNSGVNVYFGGTLNYIGRSKGTRNITLAVSDKSDNTVFVYRNGVFVKAVTAQKTIPPIPVFLFSGQTGVLTHYLHGFRIFSGTLPSRSIKKIWNMGRTTESRTIGNMRDARLSVSGKGYYAYAFTCSLRSGGFPVTVHFRTHRAKEILFINGPKNESHTIPAGNDPVTLVSAGDFERIQFNVNSSAAFDADIEFCSLLCDFRPAGIREDRWIDSGASG
ncbi:MAG: hypothetical protein ACRCU4_00690, partial [Citrobacter freundii]